MKLFIIICLLLNLLFVPRHAGITFAQEEAGQEQASAEQPQEQQTTAESEGSSEPAAEEVVSTTATPVLEIKRLETEEPLYSFELRDVDITDLFRVLAHDYKLNLMVDKDAEGKITASLTNVSLEEALETIADSQNLILKKKGSIIKIMPNLVTKMFPLKYVEAKKILEASSTSTETTSATPTQENTIYDLLSSKGKVFLGKQPNTITVIDFPPNIEKIEEYFKIVDQRMASHVFKLKYLKAADVVGEASTATSSTSEAASTTSSESSTSSSSTSGS